MMHMQQYIEREWIESEISNEETRRDVIRHYLMKVEEFHAKLNEIQNEGAEKYIVVRAHPNTLSYYNVYCMASEFWSDNTVWFQSEEVAQKFIQLLPESLQIWARMESVKDAMMNSIYFFESMINNYGKPLDVNFGAQIDLGKMVYQ